MHPELAQAHEGCFILDSLCDSGLVEFSGDADVPADEALVGLAVGEVAHELDIDLSSCAGICLR